MENNKNRKGHTWNSNIVVKSLVLKNKAGRRLVDQVPVWYLARSSSSRAYVTMHGDPCSRIDIMN